MDLLSKFIGGGAAAGLVLSFMTVAGAGYGHSAYEVNKIAEIRQDQGITTQQAISFYRKSAREQLLPFALQMTAVGGLIGAGTYRLIRHSYPHIKHM
jgi:hypothetical protein